MMLKLNYDTVAQFDSVIVVAGGPSTGSNIDKIVEYQKANNSLVIASNYNYEKIIADYTYITDYYKLVENIGKINSPLIGTESLFSIVKGKKKHFSKLTSYGKKFQIYTVGDIKKKEGVYESYENGGISISSKGDFPYFELGTSGLGSLAISILFKPKKILISGFDGPKKGNKTKMKYDGQEVPYGKPKKNKKIKRYFANSLIPTIHKHGVEKIETFEDSILYGLDKKKLGIEVI